MPLSKKQLGYAGVLVVAAGAFLWDRVTSAPAPADAAAAAAVTPGGEPATAKPSGASAPARQAGSPRENLGARLKAVSTARKVDVDDPADAFAVPADWLPKPPPAAGKSSDNEEDVEAGRAFAAKHALNAVMVRNKGGYAIVDGDGIFVGSQLGRYKLVGVTKETALFARDAVRVELRLGEKPRVWRDNAERSGREGDNSGTARTE